MADLKLQFAESDQPASGVDKTSLYSKRPEIKHLFRQPEPTPSKVVSTVFTVLCALPLVLLVVLVSFYFFFSSKINSLFKFF